MKQHLRWIQGTLWRNFSSDIKQNCPWKFRNNLRRIKICETVYLPKNLKLSNLRKVMKEKKSRLTISHQTTRVKECLRFSYVWVLPQNQTTRQAFKIVKTEDWGTMEREEATIWMKDLWLLRSDKNQPILKLSKYLPHRMRTRTSQFQARILEKTVRCESWAFLSYDRQKWAKSKTLK